MSSLTAISICEKLLKIKNSSLDRKKKLIKVKALLEGKTTPIPEANDVSFVRLKKHPEIKVHFGDGGDLEVYGYIPEDNFPVLNWLDQLYENKKKSGMHLVKCIATTNGSKSRCGLWETGVMFSVNGYHHYGLKFLPGETKVSTTTNGAPNGDSLSLNELAAEKSPAPRKRHRTCVKRVKDLIVLDSNIIIRNTTFSSLVGDVTMLYLDSLDLHLLMEYSISPLELLEYID